MLMCGGGGDHLSGSPVVGVCRVCWVFIDGCGAEAGTLVRMHVLYVPEGVVDRRSRMRRRRTGRRRKRGGGG
jgi:hypothetical protein